MTNETSSRPATPVEAGALHLDRDVIAYSIIEGSAGIRAAEHAKEFQTANWTDALRSADAVIASQRPTPASSMVGDEKDTATYNEQALEDRCIDFLEERAEEWMAESGVQRMFNAIASVFEKYAPQEIMDRFRDRLGAIGRQCHVEGALRVWEEISVQQRALGKPLPDIAALSQPASSESGGRRPYDG